MDALQIETDLGELLLERAKIDFTIRLCEVNREYLSGRLVADSILTAYLGDERLMELFREAEPVLPPPVVAVFRQE